MQAFIKSISVEHGMGKITLTTMDIAALLPLMSLSGQPLAVHMEPEQLRLPMEATATPVPEPFRR